MSRATDQWEQLLEGTTPGPWVWINDPDDVDTQYIVDWDTGGMCLSLDAIGSGSAYKPSDPVLAAAAPEAVAEVIRLLRELEAQAAAYQYMANQIEATASQAGMVGRPIMAAHYAERAKDLTRILNGESHV